MSSTLVSADANARPIVRCDEWMKALIALASRWTGADPGILERRAVRGRSPEPSAEGASAGWGSGGLPQKILKN